MLKAATAQNAGKQTGYGVELEMEWTATSSLSLLGNYAYQNSEDKDTNQDAGNAPHHQLYARANWELSMGARNLSNLSPEEPTDASLNISNDLPLERRTVFAEIRIDL